MRPSADDHAPRSWLETRISNWFWSLTPACREVARLTSEVRDRPLPPGTRMRLTLHRTFCQWCARYARQLHFLHESARHLPEHLEELSGPSLDVGAKARMKQALQKHREGES